MFLIFLHGSEPSYPVLSMQTALINMFFSDIPDDKFDLMQKGYGRKSSDDVCLWRGIHCRGGIVVTVSFHGEKHGNFSLECIPQSAKSIRIVECGQYSRLETRYLPRSSQEVNYNVNQIFGSVDLRSLPSRLRDFQALQNNLSGEIDLTRLPKHLILLSLRGNAIEQECVFYGNFPERITKITLGRQKGKGIRSFYSINGDESECMTARRVLDGIEYERIHQ